jgi:hypothetical protein
MNIEDLLEVKIKYVADNEQRALEVLAQIWKRQGRPTETLKLIAILRRTLDVCERNGYSYPKIFLLRKGELTRGEWQPRQAEPDLTSDAHVNVREHPTIPKEWIEQSERNRRRELLASGGRSK